jgi:hypothetical protein
VNTLLLLSFSNIVCGIALRQILWIVFCEKRQRHPVAAGLNWFYYGVKKPTLPNTILDAEGIEGKEFSSERGQRAGGAAAPASVVEKLLA